MPLCKLHPTEPGNFSALSSGVIARQVTVHGGDATAVARELAARLDGDGLVLAMVFHDWQLDPQLIASVLAPALPRALVAGCTTIGTIGEGKPGSAVALGLYGDWLRVGVGVAPELSRSPVAHSRDAVHEAARMLGTTPEALDPRRHTAVTLLDGTCAHPEAFCVGSAAAAPQIRFAGGCAATELGSPRRAFTWARGEVLADAGLVLLLDSKLPFQTLRSSHVVPTDVRTVVTAASGRTLETLDGKPAAIRYRELVEAAGDTVGERPTHTFARFVDGVPYVRSIVEVGASVMQLATAVEPGHVLRLMRPGDLIGTTRRDLAAAAARCGGHLGAVIAFSCIGRHWDAAARGLDGELAAAYAAHPTIGMQSYGEQSGLLLVNHTLTGLAIGVPR